MSPAKPLAPEQVQEKVLRFQEVQEQMEQLQKRGQELTQKQAEVSHSKVALEELQQQKPGAELLTAVGPGIFLKTRLLDHQLLVHAGSDVVVEKTIPDMISHLEEQRKEVMIQLVGLQAVLQELQQQAQSIYEEIKDYVQ